MGMELGSGGVLGRFGAKNGDGLRRVVPTDTTTGPSGNTPVPTIISLKSRIPDLIDRSVSSLVTALVRIFSDAVVIILFLETNISSDAG